MMSSILDPLGMTRMDGRTGTARAKRGMVPLGLVTACVLAGAVAAHAADLTATVRASDDQKQVIQIAVGKSAVVEMNEPTKKQSIAAPAIADVQTLTTSQLLLTGKAPGRTQLVVWNEDATKHRIFEVVVELDLAALESAISRSEPRARVKATAVQDAIVLSGTVPSGAAGEQIVHVAEAFAPKVYNHMEVAGQNQILLRCTVAEVSKGAVRQLGVNGWLAGENVRDMFAVNQIDGINPVNIGAGPTGNLNQPGGLQFATDENGLVLTQAPTLSLGFPRVQMQLFFQALRENSLLRILAEPNVVAVAGQEAMLLAGGEFPVPVPQTSGSGGTTITIEWKQFGVLLRFTGTPVGSDMIRLRVAPEVSEPDLTLGVTLPGGDRPIPALTQRRAETTVELASGSTIAIAGLLSERVNGVARKVPALGDVPVLGALFSSVRFQRNQTELVILVTPELVTGMNPDQVAPVPGQFMTEPNDWQLFGLGQLEGDPAADPDLRDLSVRTEVAPRMRKWTSPPSQMTLRGPWGAADERESE